VTPAEPAAAGSDLVLNQQLRITELFYSLQGETTKVGLPTVFVRLTGCPLRCRYCDTAYAFHGGERRRIGSILDDVQKYSTREVTVTGGEPLAQPNCRLLLTCLADRGYRVSLETGGALDISGIDPRVMRIVDFKTPGSGEVGRNRWENAAELNAGDQAKFVICDRDDYEWSRQKMAELNLTERCEVLFSPSSGQLPASELADWILADGLRVRLQIQLHKLLWGDAPGR
jgi:7-carboxy-7-deazaguanine synthase